MTVVRQGLTLEAFLKLPEEKPALEFVKGEVTQKSVPQGQHSLLQVTLCEMFNYWGRPGKIALAPSELRSTYGGQSTVPVLVRVAALM